MSSGRWPTDPAPIVARDWRDTLRDATDIALLGICVTLGSVMILSAGAAVAAGSRAVDEWLTTGRWPTARITVRRYASLFLPGAIASLGVLAGGAVLLLNLSAVARGAVPGGAVLAIAGAAVAVLALGLAALATVFVGRGQGFRGALASAFRMAMARPGRLAALGLAWGMAAFLALVLPAITPLAAGVALFAAHVIARRP
jgi:hypothetical protein